MRNNIVANFFGKIWGVFSSFLFVPVYINIMGFDSYSIISYTLVLAGVLAILDSGLTATLSREFSRGDKKQQDKIKTYETLEILYFAITVISISVIFFFSSLIANSLSVKNYTNTEVSFFLKIVAFDLGLQLLFRFYLGGLFGYNKQVVGNLIQVCWGIFRNGLVILVILYNPSLKLFFIWQALSTLVFALIIKYRLDSLVYEKKVFKVLKLKFNKNSFHNIKAFAGGMLLISIISVISSQTDKILISKMVNLETLGYYTLAISVSSILMVVVSPISTAILPSITNNYSLKNLVAAKALFNKYNRYISILVLGILANIIFYNKSIIWIWTGNLELVENSYIFVPILASAYAFMVLQTMCYQVALANGYTKLNNYIGIVIAIVIIPSYIISGQNWGAVGISFTFLILQILNFLFYVYFINKKFINENFLKTLIFEQLILPIFLSLILVYFLSRLLLIIPNDRLLIAILIVLSILITLVFLSVVMIPTEEKKLGIYYINNKFKSLKIKLYD